MRPHHIRVKYIIALSLFIIAIIISLHKKKYEKTDLYSMYINLIGFIVLSWYNFSTNFREGFLMSLLAMIISLVYTLYVQYKIYT